MFYNRTVFRPNAHLRSCELSAFVEAPFPAGSIASQAQVSSRYNKGREAIPPDEENGGRHRGPLRIMRGARRWRSVLYGGDARPTSRP